MMQELWNSLQELPLSDQQACLCAVYLGCKYDRPKFNSTLNTSRSKTKVRNKHYHKNTLAIVGEDHTCLDATIGLL